MIAIIDQVYRDEAGVELRYDFFRPNDEQVVPLIVCLHGGGWISGAKEDAREIAVEFARNGFATACPSYRLAPLHPYPAAVDDCRAFVAFARSKAAEWGVRSASIGSIGNSAGGHLSAMVGLADSDDEGVNAAVDICGLTDLTRPVEQHFPIAWGFLEQFMGCPYDGNESVWQAASPLWQLRSGLPPFYVIHGVDDDVVPVAQSDTFVAALRRLGNDAEYFRVPGEDHSFNGGSFGTILRGVIGFFRDKLPTA